MEENQHPLPRRTMLLGIGALGASVIAAACNRATDSATGGSAGGATTTARASGSSGSSKLTTTTAVTGSTAATATPGATDAASCTITPEVTEGPFYLDLDLVRSDITEGRPGTPLRLTITALDADGCTPLRNAAVDIWHCDASGSYSGVSNAGGPGGGRGGPGGGRSSSGASASADGGTGTTYLRGTQLTNDQGVAEFRTIHPGWYQGRAVHIHFKVHPDANTVLTSQFFFPDDFNDQVLSTGAYASRGEPDQPNANDSIYRETSGRTILKPTKDGDGYAAAAVVTVGS